jgi:hypothetical protein
MALNDHQMVAGKRLKSHDEQYNAHHSGGRPLQYARIL